jgi:hypothetical protein
MTTFVYRCPNTTLRVQGFSVDEVPDGGAGAYYVTVTCTACRGLHLVNPKTGRVAFGGNDSPGYNPRVKSGRAKARTPRLTPGSFGEHR